MAAPNSFMRGRHALAKFFHDNTLVPADVKSWTCKREGTKINDQVCGEKRSRPDFETDGYSVSIQVMVKDAKVLAAKFKEQDREDSALGPISKDMGFLLLPRDGSKFAFKFSECSLDDWELSVGGRTDTMMETIPLRARFCDTVPV